MTKTKGRPRLASVTLSGADLKRLDALAALTGLSHDTPAIWMVVNGLIRWKLEQSA